MCKVCALASRLIMFVCISLSLLDTLKEIWFDFGWDGNILDQGEVSRDLAYPIGVDIPPSQSLIWISSTILDKFEYLKFQAWHFATWLNTAHAIVFCHCYHGQRTHLKESRINMSWVSWSDICTPKIFGDHPY